MDDGTTAASALRLRLRVLRCQVGDAEAFADLYRAFGARTLRYLRGLLDEAEADDVQQDVWLTVFRRVAELQNPGGFRTWLYRVTRHRAIDALRRERRRTALLDDSEPEDLDAAGSDETPFALESDALEPALAGLSPPHREVLILRYWEDLSYAEMALVVGCSVGTIRSRLHHAKDNVRTHLEKGRTS